MKINQYFKHALALMALGATSAMATPLSFQAPQLPNYLDNATYQASFDASELLKLRYTINSLSFSFVFVDDGDTVVYTTRSSYASTPVTVITKTDAKTSVETIERTITAPRYGVGERESVKLSFDGLSFFGETAALTTSNTIPTAMSSPSQVLYARSTNGASCTMTQWQKSQVNCQQITRTTVTHYETATTTTDYFGQIAMDSSLMSYNGLLAGLVKNGKLDFSIEAMGDLIVSNASLDIDIDILPADSDLPEPSSEALVGIALLGMARARRKQRG